MKKVLVVLLGVVFLVGIADSGHAFWFFGGGGGGKGKKNAPARQGGANLNSLFKFDFDKFGVNSGTEEKDTGQNAPTEEILEDFQALSIESYCNLAAAETFGGSDAPGDVSGAVSLQVLESGTPPILNNGDSCPDSLPVPEPATMVLLGLGLIGLAGCGRRVFEK